MVDSWELVCFTNKWVADNLPPIYDTHSIEMSIWKEKNQPLNYLPEDHIYYELDKYSEDTNDTYDDEYPYEYYSDVESDSSDSEYDDEYWYY